MKISDVTAHHLRIPTSLARYPDPSGYWKMLDVVLVRIQTDQGLLGIGEAFPYVVGEAVSSVINSVLRPMLLGEDPANIREIARKLNFNTHIAGRYGITTFAISGVEIALWDLAGKRAGMPLHQLWGGAAITQIPAYASLVRHPDRSERIAEEAESALNQGYPSVKIHQSDVDSVRIAREVLGDETPLTVDINCRWSMLESIRMAEALAEFELTWLEEPVWPPEDYEALHQVQASTGVPLASGENACTAHQFKLMMDADAVTYVQPSVIKLGGIEEVLKVCRMAAQYNLEVAPHSPYFGPGFVATLHLIAHTGQMRWVERFFFDLEASLYTQPLDFENGVYQLPQGPGLGVELNEDVIREYQVKL